MPTSRARHYVPVYRDTKHGRAYAVIACGFDDNNHVADWDEFPMGIAVVGKITDLVTDLTMMVSACIRHHPVNFDELRVGMSMKPADPIEVANCQRAVRNAIDTEFGAGGGT